MNILNYTLQYTIIANRQLNIKYKYSNDSSNISIYQL